MNLIAERLKLLRKEKKITQKELAELINVKRENIAKWETGKCKPNYEGLEKIADFFEVSLDWLVGRDK